MMTALAPHVSPEGKFERLAANLPPMICFRVTRFCNAQCGFCLAPPDGGVHPSAAVLMSRIDWLLERGVTTIHFCGGEPTIHRNLSELIAHVEARGAKTHLTTNGLALNDGLFAALRAGETQVKVSLHGARDHHNAIVGGDAFDRTTATIRRLLSIGIGTSVQTTIVSGHLNVVPWMIRFCLEHSLRRVSFLPFIPRGVGYERRQEYTLSERERGELRTLVRKKRREHGGRLDIRLLDFNSRPIHVVEPDGRVVLESSTEAYDTVLYRIPEPREIPATARSSDQIARS